MEYRVCKKCGKKGLHYHPRPNKKRGDNLRGNFKCRYCGKYSL